MKKLLCSLIFLVGILALSSCSKDDPDPILPEVAFPDAKFRAALMDLGFVETNGSISLDDPTNKALFASTTKLELLEKGIASLKGIECFTALTELVCSGNELTTLDMSKNTALTILNCICNELTTLDISKNTALTRLDCYYNQLTVLDVSKNTALTELYCWENRLTALDVTKNTALTKLDCENNLLKVLDVTKNTALTFFTCTDNQLAALDISKNTALTDLGCSTNQLKALDVAKNTQLTQLSCYGNQLSALDISMLSHLDLRYSIFGNQQSNQTLTLTLTAAQDTNWTNKDDSKNVRITSNVIPN